jgi:6-phosphogluconolactonase (cycloisomerase 2 family)
LCVVVVALACALAAPAVGFGVVGSLSFVGVVKDGVGGVDGLGGAVEVAQSPDGKHVYVAGYSENAVAVFASDPTSGALTFVGAVRDGVGGVDGLDHPIVVAVSPDGKNVYVAGESDDAVAVFARDPTSGALTFVGAVRDGVGGVDGLDGAFGVAVTSDGKHVYVTGQLDDAVAVFARDPASGSLTFVEAVKNGVGGVDGLDSADGVALSLDGKYLYVASRLDNAVAVFARDATSGALTFVEALKDGVGGVDGLNSAAAVAVSRDGKQVYVAGQGDDAVAVFARDATSGALSFVGAVKDGVGGVDGLDGAFGVAVSPNGKNVYATGRTESAAAVFARDPTSGALTFVEAAKDGVGGVDGLKGAAGVVVSPDAKHVYVTGQGDGAVATFARELLPRTLTVTTSGAGSGIVRGPGIDCGPATAGDCTEPVDDGLAITLTAHPAANATFATFTGGGCSTASACSVTMSADTSVDASFALTPAGGGASTAGGVSSPGVASAAGTAQMCEGVVATLVAKAGQTRIIGTAGRDVIIATDAADRIDGRGGDDIICANRGDDIIHGSAGRDVIRGGAGNDRAFGDSGDDRLLGGPGRDDLRGGAGRDRLGGGDGDDRVDGGAGDDVLDEFSLGGRGKDRLFGAAGNDRVRTAGGTMDTVDCGPGRDFALLDAHDKQRRCDSTRRV